MASIAQAAFHNAIEMQVRMAMCRIAKMQQQQQHFFFEEHELSDVDSVMGWYSLHGLSVHTGTLRHKQRCHGTAPERDLLGDRP